MSKLLNGKLNECGVIVPLNDRADIIFNKAEDSLLYRSYKSGPVEAKIELAEFDDGEAACRSEARASYTGYSSPMTMSDKTERRSAVMKEMTRIIDFVEGILRDSSSEKTAVVDRCCRRVLERVKFDWALHSKGLQVVNQEEPAILPLEF
jgi:hypothetical protein